MRAKHKRSEARIPNCANGLLPFTRRRSVRRSEFKNFKWNPSARVQLLRCSRKSTSSLTLGPGRSLIHGVAPHRCDQVAGPLLGGDAGGRSPGVLSSRLGILDAVLKSNYSQIQLLQSHSFVRGAPLPHHAPRHPRDPWEKRAVLMLVPQIESRITGGA